MSYWTLFFFTWVTGTVYGRQALDILVAADSAGRECLPLPTLGDEHESLFLHYLKKEHVVPLSFLSLETMSWPPGGPDLGPQDEVLGVCIVKIRGHFYCAPMEASAHLMTMC